MIGIGVIGVGAWGRNHVRVVVGEPRCRLAAIADPDPATRQPGVANYRRADELLRDPAVDAVIISSPAPTHSALACAALAAGKHLIVEKPFAMSTAEATAVSEAARAHDRVVVVGHLMLYHPAVVRLRELLVSGTLGALHYLHSTRVNLGRLRRDENALWSFGPHDLSMIDYLLDKQPASVTARGQCVLQPGVEDVVFLTLRYSTGELAHVQLSWLSPRKERRLTLVCSQKMVEFDDVAAAKLRVYDKGYDYPPVFTEYAQYLTIRDGDVHIPHLVMQEPLQLQLAHFLDCILEGAKPRSDVASALRVVRVLEAASRSLERDGAPIEVANTL